MRKVLMFIGCLSILNSSRSQASNTGTQVITDIITATERDYAGFTILTDRQKQEYKKLKENILLQAAMAGRFEVNVLANEYLSFFRDGHLHSIYFKNDYSDSIKTNIYPGKTISIKNLSGLWYVKDFDMIFSIRKARSGHEGVVFKDLNGYEKKGTRFLKFFPAYEKNTCTILFYNSGGISFSRHVRFKDGIFYEGTSKVFMRPVTGSEALTLKTNIQADEEPTMKEVSKNTLLLKIPSLYSGSGQIDSLLNVYKEKLDRLPNLVIDLRDNGGGSVLPTLGIVKYIKTGPVHYVSSYCIASDTMISTVKEFCSSNTNDSSAYFKSYCTQFFRSLEMNKGKLVFDSTEIYTGNEPVRKMPMNVAILINSNTASAAELFVLAAKQSRKVKIFGENSAGAVDFGTNIFYQTSHPHYIFSLTMEMAEYIPAKRYDDTGITPDVWLKGDEATWVKQVIEYYRKRSAK